MSCNVQVGATLTIELTLFECKDPPVIPKVVISISSQTAMDIILLGPGAVRIVKAASFVTDGTDGEMTATVDAGEITVAGSWQYQGIVTLPNGEVKTLVRTFTVKNNI